MSQPAWHSIESTEVLQRLESSSIGLTSKEAQKRLGEYGPNVIPEKQPRSLLLILLGQFTDFMIVVLLLAALISGFIGEPQDTIAILVIVLLNAIVGAVQEFRAERAVEALRNMAAPEAQVLRDGRAVTLASTELVPGDVVLIEAGNIVPADLRLLEVEEMQADESALTGESLTVQKQSMCIPEAALAIGDRFNLAFKSSMISRGRGKGVVVACGQHTEIGHIAKMLQVEAGVKTPLQLRLSRFGRYLALAVLAICTVVFIAGLLQGQPLMLMLLTAISLAVAAIPEALPAVVTVSLALGAYKLVRFNALVRNLPAVETLGSVTYICTDKTGTLTQNRMAVEYFIADGQCLESLPDLYTSLCWAELGQALALNNDVAEKDGRPAGEPTELALYEAARRAGYDKAALEQVKQRLAVIPFDSQRKQMTTLHRSADGVVAYVKGAPEQVLERSAKTLWDEASEEFDARTLLAEAEQLASKGYRVLALAKREFAMLPKPLDAEIIEQDLTFLGLVALIDPPRPEAHQAVVDCLTAGITPVMITGDHPGTAMAIARRLGIIDDAQTMLSGDELAALPDDEFAR
ncbi:MAG: HAD-IC family P-type ATPase, partial [Gammaproteobacteria bacterium]|nr:HAD-IC family P-type ATPase [Gammaproteobacteria bacterium]